MRCHFGVRWLKKHTPRCFILLRGTNLPH
jgi:hypothetical protein